MLAGFEPVTRWGNYQTKTYCICYLNFTTYTVSFKFIFDLLYKQKFDFRFIMVRRNRFNG